MEIIPSIIAHDFSEVQTKITRLDGLVGWVQLDIMDGRFVTPSTWSVAEDLKAINGNIRLEAHLMVEQPEEIVKDWTAVADRILVHYEATNDLTAIISVLDNTTCRFGVVLNLDTPVKVLADYSPKLAYIQLMSIPETGYRGTPLNKAVYEKIKAVRNLWPRVKISVDGGVNLANAPELIAAGADNLVIGSAIWESGNVEETIKKFQSLVS